MTPFDPSALLAMLLTFYPIVSVAALRLARQERPDYFAAGTLGGSKGEKLTLPDGRIFDLIFAVDGPEAPRWQVIDVTFAGPGVDDPAFALQPGPLRPIDLAAWPRLLPVNTFEPLVAAALVELVGSDDGFGRASGDLVAGGTGADIDRVWQATLGSAPDVLADLTRRLDTIEPSDVALTTLLQGNDAFVREGAYDETPGDLPETSWPGDPPGDDVTSPIDVQLPEASV